MKSKIGAIVQARYSSTRLPGKILMKLPYGGNITVLEQVIGRLKKSKLIDEIIIATTTKKQDEKTEGIAIKQRVGCFRGSMEDVLSRYYSAAKENKLDIVVRATSDCPCIDAEIVDMLIKRHIESGADYTNNALKITYPRGVDTEVFDFDVLERAHIKAVKGYEREHVTPYIYHNPGFFKILSVKAPRVLFAPDIRITLDTQEDYALLCAVFNYLYPQNNFFKTADVVKLFKNKPWLKLINKKIVQKKLIDTFYQEIAEAVKVLDLQGLKKASDLLRASLK